MKKGDHIQWKWGNGHAEGTIKSVHHESTTIKTKGKDITRNGSKEDPALVISHESGDNVLKLASEVEPKK
jgi:hypothetical protein